METQKKTLLSSWHLYSWHATGEYPHDKDCSRRRPRTFSIQLWSSCKFVGATASALPYKKLAVLKWLIATLEANECCVELARCGHCVLVPNTCHSILYWLNITSHANSNQHSITVVQLAMYKCSYIYNCSQSVLCNRSSDNAYSWCILFRKTGKSVFEPPFGGT